MTFAELDKNGTVLRVIVAEQDFVDKMPGLWVASKSAGKGYSYDAKADSFVAPADTTAPAMTANASVK